MRAIHLELLPSLTIGHFLQAFLRFTNYYRIPEVVFSDNQSTFIAALKILGPAKVDSDFSKFLVDNNIKHVRIPVYSAWWAGTWERMVGVMKRTLHKVVGRRRLDYFELLTILTDVQNAVNNRPLCHVDNEDLDSKILTPNMFLKVNSGQNLVISGTEIESFHPAGQRELVRLFDKRQDIFENLKDVWYNEYLLSLREAGRNLYQRDWENVVQPGDIVLVTSPNKARVEWSFGRVTELCPGGDGKVRAVKLIKPDRSESVFPINLLYPMELSVSPVKVADHPENSQRDPRPNRAAAKACLQRLKASS